MPLLSDADDLVFRDTPDGRAYFPHGPFGVGRLITPAIEATTKERRKYASHGYLIGFFFPVLSGAQNIIGDAVLLMPFLIIFAVDYYVDLPSRSAPRTLKRMSLEEWNLARARHTSRDSLMMSLGFTLLFLGLIVTIAAGVCLYLLPDSKFMAVGTVFIAALMVLCLGYRVADTLRILRLQRRLG